MVLQRITMKRRTPIPSLESRMLPSVVDRLDLDSAGLPKTHFTRVFQKSDSFLGSGTLHLMKVGK
jgi:hypothetical protein